MLPVKANKLNKWLLLGGVIFATNSYANLTAHIKSFEEDYVPSWVTGSATGAITLSDKRAILGEQSLHWQWHKNSQLRLENLNITRITDDQATGEYNIGSGATQVLSFWIYNEQATLGHMTVELKDNNNSAVTTTFPVQLNFTGWRAIGVSLNLDLDKKFANSTELSSITFTAPNNAENMSKGLYLDRVMVSVDDKRYQWSDAQVTTRFVEPEIDFGLPAKLPIPTPEQLADAEQVKQALLQEFASTSASMTALEAKFAEFKISEDKDGVIRGRHLLTDKQQVIYQPAHLSDSDQLDFVEYAILGDSDVEKPTKTTGYAKLMLDIAKTHNQSNSDADKARLSEMYRLMSLHLLDQGFADGSSLVTTHHWGYSSRNWYISALMMEQTLAEHQLVEPIYRALLWYAREFKDSFEMNVTATSSNLDYFNTLSREHLALLLLNPNENERIALLDKYSTFISGALAQTPPGTNDGFRPDGTAFRHHGNYPGYAFPAFSSAGQLAYILKDSAFSLDKPGMNALKKAMVTGWIYSNPHVSLGNVGRHPFTDLSVSSYANAMKLLALSYPALDEELAAIYLQITGKTESESTAIFGQRIKPAALPQGSWSFNGGAFGIHRQGDRMAIMKGYNKDVWSSEIYTKDNRYGRYQSHGSVHVIPYGNSKDLGYKQEGWDWNRNPGTTTIHLDIDELESPKSSTLMVRSKKGVSGSVALENKFNLFTFKHNDLSDQIDFNKEFVAHKQVFAVGETLYLVGNGISNSDSANRTETTLFQLAINNPVKGVTIYKKAANSTQRITTANFSQTLTSGDWIIDDNGVGYYLIDAKTVKVQRAIQYSKHNKTEKNTSGNFSSAWIDHGTAPNNASYEYIMVMDANESKMKAIASSVASTPLFKVLQTDATKQLIWSKTDNLYGYTSYVDNDVVNTFSQGPIRAIDTTALVMTREASQDGVATINLSLAALELNLTNNDQKVVAEPVTIEITGLWQSDNGEFSHSDNTTTLTLDSLFGQSVNAILWPQDEEKPEQPLIPLDPSTPVEPPKPTPPAESSGGSLNYSLLAFLALMLALRIRT